MQCQVCQVYQGRTVDENACAVEGALKEEIMWLRTRSSHRGPVSLPWGTSKGQKGHGRPFGIVLAILSCVFLHCTYTEFLSCAGCVHKDTLGLSSCIVI